MSWGAEVTDPYTLRTEVLAWAERRNRDQTSVNWTFSQAKARDKFQRHYGNVQKLI
jgi:hypothetical protein